MKNTILRLLLPAFLLASSHAALAATNDIQMLPPTDFNSPTPCNMSSNLNQVLVFNPGAGTGSAINCNTAFTADSSGRLGVAGFSPTFGMPTDWGGIHTWDLYAEGSVGVGNSSVSGGSVNSGTPSAYMNNAGNIYASTSIISGGIIQSATTIQVGGGSCTAAGQLQWDGTKIQFCDGTNWKDLGGSDRTWHGLAVPSPDTCMKNDSVNEMTITMSCLGYRWGMELYITSGPDAGSCGNFIAGEGGVAHVPGPGPSSFGMQGTIPPGWWWKWTAAAGTIPGVANCLSAADLY